MKSTNMGERDARLTAETARRIFAALIMWGGWAFAAFVFAWATLEFDPQKGHFAPQWVGFAFIGALCLAIAGTLVRSRMRLQETILEAFAAGVTAAQMAAQAEHDELHRKIEHAKHSDTGR